jgi:hypothetical protein
MFNLGPVSVRSGPKRRTELFEDGVGPDRQEMRLGPNRFWTDPKIAWTDRSVRSNQTAWTGPIGRTDLGPKSDVA